MKASVSVIIPCYQCENTIVRAVKSVVAQTLKPNEVILIDDASNDSTIELLLSLQKQYEDGWIQVIRLEKNRGVSFARNEGWMHAKSDYIAFLDADDSWHPRKIELQYQWMIEHPSVDLCGHIISNNEPLEQSTPILCGEIVFSQLMKFKFLLSNYLSTPTVMLKRNISFRFDEKQYFAEDYLLWLSVLCSGLKVCKLELELAYMHKRPYGESGLSQNLWAMEKGELKVYKKIYKSGYLRRYQYYFFSTYSFAKYLRRLLMEALN